MLSLELARKYPFDAVDVDDMVVIFIENEERIIGVLDLLTNKVACLCARVPNGSPEWLTIAQWRTLMGDKVDPKSTKHLHIVSRDFDFSDCVGLDAVCQKVRTTADLPTISLSNMMMKKKAEEWKENGHSQSTIMRYCATVTEEDMEARRGLRQVSSRLTRGATTSAAKRPAAQLGGSAGSSKKRRPLQSPMPTLTSSCSKNTTESDTEMDVANSAPPGTAAAADFEVVAVRRHDVASPTPPAPSDAAGDAAMADQPAARNSLARLGATLLAEHASRIDCNDANNTGDLGNVARTAVGNIAPGTGGGSADRDAADKDAAAVLLQLKVTVGVPPKLQQSIDANRKIHQRNRELHQRERLAKSVAATAAGASSPNAANNAGTAAGTGSTAAANAATAAHTAAAGQQAAVGVTAASGSGVQSSAVASDDAKLQKAKHVFAKVSAEEGALVHNSMVSAVTEIVSVQAIMRFDRSVDQAIAETANRHHSVRLLEQHNEQAIENVTAAQSDGAAAAAKAAAAAAALAPTEQQLNQLIAQLAVPGNPDRQQLLADMERSLHERRPLAARSEDTAAAQTDSENRLAARRGELAWAQAALSKEAEEWSNRQAQLDSQKEAAKSEALQAKLVWRMAEAARKVCADRVMTANQKALLLLK